MDVGNENPKNGERGMSPPPPPPPPTPIHAVISSSEWIDDYKTVKKACLIFQQNQEVEMARNPNDLHSLSSSLPTAECGNRNEVNPVADKYFVDINPLRRNTASTSETPLEHNAEDELTLQLFSTRSSTPFAINVLSAVTSSDLERTSGNLSPVNRIANQSGDDIKHLLTSINRESSIAQNKDVNFSRNSLKIQYSNQFLLSIQEHNLRLRNGGSEKSDINMVDCKMIELEALLSHFNIAKGTSNNRYIKPPSSVNRSRSSQKNFALFNKAGPFKDRNLGDQHSDIIDTKDNLKPSNRPTFGSGRFLMEYSSSSNSEGRRLKKNESKSYASGEPEWYNNGPSSRSDTIELGGFTENGNLEFFQEANTNDLQKSDCNDRNNNKAFFKKDTSALKPLQTTNKQSDMASLLKNFQCLPENSKSPTSPPPNDTTLPKVFKKIKYGDLRNAVQQKGGKKNAMNSQCFLPVNQLEAHLCRQSTEELSGKTNADNEGFKKIMNELIKNGCNYGFISTENQKWRSFFSSNNSNDKPKINREQKHNSQHKTQSFFPNQQLELVAQLHFKTILSRPDTQTLLLRLAKGEISKQGLLVQLANPFLSQIDRDVIKVVLTFSANNNVQKYYTECLSNSLVANQLINLQNLAVLQNKLNYQQQLEQHQNALVNEIRKNISAVHNNWNAASTFIEFLKQRQNNIDHNQQLMVLNSVSKPSPSLVSQSISAENHQLWNLVNEHLYNSLPKARKENAIPIVFQSQEANLTTRNFPNICAEEANYTNFQSAIENQLNEN